jgi:toluene monooxygenase system protein A
MPSPDERKWLALKYPKYWQQIDLVWDRIGQCWEACDPGIDLGVHGTSIVGFCDLCQIVLCGGTPINNTARVNRFQGQKYVFCSEPCEEIFLSEPEKYSSHKNLVRRVLDGEAPGNLLAMLTKYFGLNFETWGKDSYQGVYSWLHRSKQNEHKNKKDQQ